MDWFWLGVAVVVAGGLYLWGASAGTSRRLRQARRQAQDDIAKSLGADQGRNSPPWS